MAEQLFLIPGLPDSPLKVEVRPEPESRDYPGREFIGLTSEQMQLLGTITQIKGVDEILLVFARAGARLGTRAGEDRVAKVKTAFDFFDSSFASLSLLADSHVKLQVAMNALSLIRKAVS